MHKWLTCIHDLNEPLEIRKPKREEIDILIDLYDQAIRGAFASDGYEDVDFDILEELNLKRSTFRFLMPPSLKDSTLLGL